MTCDNCGSSCQGHRCAECEMIAAAEAKHGETAEEDDRTWAVEQTGLDGEAEGQATLSGDVVKPTGGEGDD